MCQKSQLGTIWRLSHFRRFKLQGNVKILSNRTHQALECAFKRYGSQLKPTQNTIEFLWSDWVLGFFGLRLSFLLDDLFCRISFFIYLLLRRTVLLLMPSFGRLENNVGLIQQRFLKHVKVSQKTSKILWNTHSDLKIWLRVWNAGP